MADTGTLHVWRVSIYYRYMDADDGRSIVVVPRVEHRVYIERNILYRETVL